MAGQQKANAAVPSPSTKPAGQGAGVVPENLYHTTLTVIDHHATTSGAINNLHVLGTHTTLDAAKAFAYHDALRSLNYQPYDFSIYATRESFGMPLEGQPPTTAAPVAATAAAPATTPKPTTAAAKVAAENSGAYESGYSTDTGAASDTDTGGPPIWPYGDEVLVYAKARGGQEFLLGVVETPNTEHLASGGAVYGNTPVLPTKSKSTKPTSTTSPKSKSKQPLEKEEEAEPSDTELSYVIQTKTDYNQALAPGQPEPTTRPRRRSSITRLFQACEIEACFPHKSDAIDFARRWLDSKKDSGMFVQYDEQQTPRSLPTLSKEEEEDNEEGQQIWPFGEDVLVHAVASTGENYCVAVRTAEGARERFGKKVVRRGGREVPREEGGVRSYYEDSPKIAT
ncbi:hypothetical protein B0H65DRAFT_168357 [Neurospora tetraspora]|uniref:Uncharacterized protein n=1 Tax=Neurospora tetraspora TaxID=94610 RepID=A0AAE0MTS6_9PEZI|nr:hypothetical protein B0H65DRAFT_168357 [Neurospora tetraspora]